MPLESDAEPSSIVCCKGTTTAKASSVLEKQHKNNAVIDGQVDLFPKSWCQCCSSDFCNEEESCPEEQDVEEEEEEAGFNCGGAMSMLGSFIWRTCFFAACFPMCYPCYVCRSVRRRPKMDVRAEIARREPPLTQQPRTLVTEFTDGMNRTLFRQVSHAKKSTAYKRSRTVDSLNNGDGDGGGENENEERGNAPSVINVNVIILQSASSRLLHQYISNVAPSSRIKVTSTSSPMTAPLGDDANNAARRKNNILCREQTPIYAKANYPNLPHYHQHQRFSSNSNDGTDGKDFSLDLTLVEEEAEEEEEQVPANNSSSSSLDDDAFFQDCVSVQEEEDHRPHSQHRLIHQSQGHHHEQDFPMERIGIPNFCETSCGDSNGAEKKLYRKPNDENAFGGGTKMKNDPFLDREEILKRKKKRNPTERSSSFSHMARRLSFVRPKLRRQNVCEIEEEKEKGEENGGTSLLQSYNNASRARSASTSNSSSIGRKPSFLIRWKGGKDEVNDETRYEEDVDDLGDNLEDEDEDCLSSVGVPLRRKRKSFLSKQRRRPNKYIRVSSHYYSFEEDELEMETEHVRHPLVQMRSLGSRTEALRDIGYSLTFSVFDEDSVSQWDGRDLREAKDLPNVDLVVVAVKQNHLIELSDLLNADAGMMSYIRNFWRGFHPLLLIELQTMHDSAEIVPEYTQRLKQFRQLFGDVHQIGVFEDRLSRDSDWILECMARLFVHSRLFQCPRFYGGAAVRNLHGADKCPGGCELRKRRPRDRKFAGRRKVKSASMRDHHHGDNPTIMTTAGWSNYQKSVYGRAKTTNSVFN